MARDMTVGREGNHILAFALPIMGGLVLQHNESFWGMEVSSSCQALPVAVE